MFIIDAIFLVKILKPVIGFREISNADAVKNMKTSWPTFYSPDVKIHLHPTCYNYIQFKHTSFYLVLCSFSSSSKLCSGWCSRFLQRRFQVWILVVFPALAWVFSWVQTCQFGTDVCVWCIPPAWDRKILFDFCRDRFCWLTNSFHFKCFKKNITEVKSWGQPALEWIILDVFGMLNEGVFS